jgi:hypothetical protein
VTAANDALLRDFALRAVKAQPLGYLHAVLGGLALSVEWPRHPYPDPGTVYFYYFHLTPYPIPAHHSWVAGGTAYSDAVQYGHATPSRVVRPVAYLIDGYQRVFYTYGPLFGLILLTGLGGVLRIRRPPGRHPVLAWSPRAGSMLPWATAVVLLVFPIAVADFDYRYLLPVLPFACLAAGLAFAPARGLGIRAGRVDRQPPPAVGVTLPDRGVLGAELAAGRDPHHDDSERVAEIARAGHLVQPDRPLGVRGPGPPDGLPPEPLDRVAAADQVGVLGQEPGVLGVERGHARGVARVEQRLELAGELLDFLVLQRGQRHHGFPSR